MKLNKSELEVVRTALIKYAEGLSETLTTQLSMKSVSGSMHKTEELKETMELLGRVEQARSEDFDNEPELIEIEQ